MRLKIWDRKNFVCVAIVLLVAGLAGCDGSNGDNGAQGATGSSGADGAPGAPGPQGPAGADSVLVNLRVIGRYATGMFDEGAQEIVSYDPVSQRLFGINANAVSLDVVDLFDPTAPALLGTLDLGADGGATNSTSAFNGVVAVALAADPKTDPGKVVFFDAQSLQRLGEVTVGANPDMITYTPDGTAVLVANEGEPNEGYSIDPEGSVSVIDVSNGYDNLSVATADFTAFNAQIDSLRASGVRIYGPGASVAQDLEPEYIAVAAGGGGTAWVTLQEANSVAELDFSDLANPVITAVRPLGVKDHSIIGNELDASDRDGRINIRNWPVFGLYEPDSAASLAFNGQSYYVTANEGDDRDDFIPGGETERVKDLDLDPTAFPDAAALQEDAQLGRLTVTTFDGDTDGDGDFDQLFVLGGRSFAIYAADGSQVFDSGSQFERITAQRFPQFFNANNDDNDFEGRSDNKGPEPEGLTTGQIGGRTFAFIGLERISGVMVYDVTNPQNPSFVQYINPRDFTKEPTDPTVGDLGPEGFLFVSAQDSPNGNPLLLVGNEVSGTTTIYQIDVIQTQ